jgi:hypothetical protein
MSTPSLSGSGREGNAHRLQQLPVKATFLGRGPCAAVVGAYSTLRPGRSALIWRTNLSISRAELALRGASST